MRTKSQLNQKTPSRRNGAYRLACGLVSLSSLIMVSGCGSGNEASKQAALTNPTHLPFATTPPAPGVFPGAPLDLPTLPNLIICGDLSQFPASIAPLFYGTYFGSIQDSSTGNSQPYTMLVSSTTVKYDTSGRRYPWFKFDSDGSIGAIHFTEVGCTHGSVNSPNGVSFGIASIAHDLPVITSSAPLSIELILAVRSGVQIDPAQSSIHFEECGFSRGVDCSSYAGYVSFVDDLGKR